MSKSLELLKERRSAKRFVSDFEVSDAQITEILESARFAPSSFGMEPFKLAYISNKDIRNELLEPWWNQPGVNTASGLLVWMTPLEETIEKEIIPSQNERNIPEEFKDIREQMTGGLHAALAAHGISHDEWASRGAYISLGTVLGTAQELGIDLCPSEGFDPKAVGEVLAKHDIMDNKKWKVAVGAFVGKVDTNQDFHHFFSKTRKPADESYKIVK
ncbi:nitroreductase [Spiroplasma chinense]|uniref:Nitroreductase n=1 Tax=Spiroplasma chinense TaxID=216932 RepID=A0A5B9Y5B5_9MOLU|nr:nitroreductase family protein [Spiroplasma chinense]QEH61447.1 nitroreductase [Spiroplasma chinense]